MTSRNPYDAAVSEDTPEAGWTVGSILSIVVALFCMTPTAITVLIVVGMFVFNVGMYLSASASGAGDMIAWTVLISLFYSTMAGLVSAPFVAVCSITLHPIGVVAGLLGMRSGALKSGGLLALANAVTFMAGAGVALGYLVVLGAAVVS